MVIYGLKNCDTCRAARKKFPSAEFIDVRETPLTREQLTRWSAAPDSDLLNRSSTTWRALSPEERERNPLDLILEHPALLKRPVIEDGSRVLQGKDALK